jgi:isochorismate synthase
MTDLEKITKLSDFEQIVRGLSALDLQIAVYKIPNQSNIYLIANDEVTLQPKEPDIEQMKGFLISGFDSQSDEFPRFYIKPRFYAVFGESGLEIVSNELGINLPNLENKKSSFYYKKNSIYPLEYQFTKEVQNAINYLQKSYLQKVVLSKTKKIKKKDNFDELNFFNQLILKHPESFIALVSTQVSGTWIGASPEILIHIDAKNTFKTVALAGTKMMKNEGENVSEANWTEKEIEEQALVSRYIINCFKKIRVREYEDIGPKTVQQGHLLHLKTEFKVNINEINFENLGSVMLKLLHPTSAVCGMPKEEALGLIGEIENYSRAYYTGYWGAVNMAGNTHIYVNIRCLQIFEDILLLYAGAGITSSSNSEKENLEIENKLSLLENILSSIG